MARPSAPTAGIVVYGSCEYRRSPLDIDIAWFEPGPSLADRLRTPAAELKAHAEPHQMR
jgi:hypothetical protein